MVLWYLFAFCYINFDFQSLFSLFLLIIALKMQLIYLLIFKVRLKGVFCARGQLFLFIALYIKIYALIACAIIANNFFLLFSVSHIHNIYPCIPSSVLIPWSTHEGVLSSLNIRVWSLVYLFPRGNYMLHKCNYYIFYILYKQTCTLTLCRFEK